MLPEMEIGSTFARPWRHVMAMGLEFSEPRLWEPCANYPLRRAAPCALVVLHEAGLRIHGTTKARPAEVFASEERALLLPAPDERWICLITASPRSSRPHISVLGRPYSVPTAFVGNRVKVRADSQLVMVYNQGELVKTTPEASRRSVYGPRRLPRAQ